MRVHEKNRSQPRLPDHDPEHGASDSYELTKEFMHPMLNTAIKAARKAGTVIQRGARDLDRLTVTSKGPKDFVSEVDKGAEAAIVETLLEAYPDHGILAEEGTINSRAKNLDNIWIIDPLDGTTNFLHGLPHYCVSIALQHKGVITQAVIYDPNRNDLFTATRGGGAYLNDRRLRVSRRIRMDEALIATGFPFKDGSLVETYLDMMREMMHKTAGLRRAGAAALDIAYVAAGWYEGFWEAGINSWDMAAGSLLVVEAGGLVTDIYGEDQFLQNGTVVAATPKILPQMLQVLSPHMKKAHAAPK